MTEDAFRARLAELHRQVGILQAQHEQMMALLQREFVHHRDAMDTAATERRAMPGWMPFFGGTVLNIAIG